MTYVCSKVEEEGRQGTDNVQVTRTANFHHVLWPLLVSKSSQVSQLRSDPSKKYYVVDTVEGTGFSSRNANMHEQSARYRKVEFVELNNLILSELVERTE
jgi:hypothetical protein